MSDKNTLFNNLIDILSEVDNDEDRYSNYRLGTLIALSNDLEKINSAKGGELSELSGKFKDRLTSVIEKYKKKSKSESIYKSKYSNGFRINKFPSSNKKSKDHNSEEDSELEEEDSESEEEDSGSVEEVSSSEKSKESMQSKRSRRCSEDSDSSDDDISEFLSSMFDNPESSIPEPEDEDVKEMKQTIKYIRDSISDSDNVFSLIYNKLKQIHSKPKHCRDMYIDAFKDYIFSTDCVNSDGYNMLLYMHQIDKPFAMELAISPYASTEYLTQNEQYDGFDYITTIIFRDFDSFEQLVKTDRIKSDSLQEAFYRNFVRYFFALFQKKNFGIIKLFIDEMLMNSSYSTKEVAKKLYEYSDHNMFGSYNIISTLLEKQDNRISLGTKYKDVLKYIMGAEWMTEEILKDLCLSIFTDGNFATILMLTVYMSNEQKVILATQILTDPNMVVNKCMRNIATDVIIANKEVAQMTGTPRIHFIIDTKDDITLQRLLTSPEFNKLEFRETWNGGQNCLMYCLAVEPKLLKVLMSSDYFDIDIVKHIDDSGRDIKWYIKRFGKKNTYALNLYSMFFSESDSIEYEIDDPIACKLACNICMEREINIRIAPCGHTICSQCINDTTIKCPFCAKEITDFQQIILS